MKTNTIRKDNIYIKDKIMKTKTEITKKGNPNKTRRKNWRIHFIRGIGIFLLTGH